jgi:hypothetical protein
VFGRRKLPAKLSPKLDRSERVLAWARTAEDANAVVVVTTLGLWVPGRPRLGWHQINKATWSGARLTVVPAVAVGDPVPMDGHGTSRPVRGDAAVSFVVMADDAAVSVHLADPGDVPTAVRQRVTRSVAYTVHHPLSTGGVRVVARRVPGMDGLAWHVRYDEGTHTADPAVIATTAELVAEAATPVRTDE